MQYILNTLLYSIKTGEEDAYGSTAIDKDMFVTKY